MGSSDSKPKIKTGFVIDGKSNVTIENLKVENSSLGVSSSCDGNGWVYGIITCKNGGNSGIKILNSDISADTNGHAIANWSGTIAEISGCDLKQI